MSKEKKKKSGLGKFIAGVAIGTGIGVLFAPKKGSETRAELKEKMQELYKKAKELECYFEAISFTEARKEALTYIQGMKDLFALLKRLSH